VKKRVVPAHRLIAQDLRSCLASSGVVEGFFMPRCTPEPGQRLLLQGGNSVRSFLMIAVAGAAVLAMTSSPAFSRESDHLVWHGKAHLPVSKVPARETVVEPSVKVIPSSGRYVRQGKSQVWVPTDRTMETSEPSSSSQTRETSKGRFVQRGKAQVWVPNDK
jgi:hypothetical protein